MTSFEIISTDRVIVPKFSYLKLEHAHVATLCIAWTIKPVSKVYCNRSV